MTFDSFLNKISEIKSYPLLAPEAHLRMAPKERLPFLNPLDHLNKHPKKSAVLMLFYPNNQEPYIVLIKRAKSLGVHSVQIGLPGGKFEPADTNLTITALRETHEEIGVLPSKVEIIKSLSPVYIPPSNFMVSPFVGLAQQHPLFIPEPSEVSEIIEVPVKELINAENVQTVIKSSSYAQNMKVPAFTYNDHIIWGATAMMLNELKEILLKVF